MWGFEQFPNGRRLAKQMIAFREVFPFCDLHDLGFISHPWTYDNKQKGKNNVWVRLDRDVASPSWSQWVPDVRLQRIPTHYD
jgi:hypothetical protein